MSMGSSHSELQCRGRGVVTLGWLLVQQAGDAACERVVEATHKQIAWQQFLFCLFLSTACHPTVLGVWEGAVRWSWHLTMPVSFQLFSRFSSFLFSILALGSYLTCKESGTHFQVPS